MTEPKPQRPPEAPGYTAAADDPFRPAAWSEVAAALTDARNYWVCTTRPDGRPHVSPVWGLWLANAAWFSTGGASVKARNLAANPFAIIHLESGDNVVILEGEVELISSTDQEHAVACQQWVIDYKTKYDIQVDLSEPEFMLYRLAPTKLLTWSEKDFPYSNTRWVIN